MRATDPDGLSVDRTFTIGVNDVNEAPTNLGLDHASVDKNAPAGTLVGTVSADDPDHDTLAYTLVDDAGGRFALDPSTGALTTTAAFDYETNTGFSVTVRATDPDGLSVDRTFAIGVNDVNEAPTDLGLDHARSMRMRRQERSSGRSAPTIPIIDTLAYSLVDNAGGRFALDAVDRRADHHGAFDYEANTGFSVTVRATDPDGLSVDRTFAIGVNDVNEAPTAQGDAAAVNEDATTANLWTSLLANDSDPDAGTTLSIQSVDTTGTLGHVLFDAATHSLRYVADADAFDALAPGATAVDHFTYTVTDGHGLTSTATVAVTVTGIADGITVFAGNGNDLVNGTGRRGSSRRRQWQ